MFIIVMKTLIHICNQIFCPIPIRNTLLLLLYLYFKSIPIMKLKNNVKLTFVHKY